MDADPKDPEPAAPYAFLSRRVFRSPRISFILAGSIRNSSNNDAILVGPDYIEIKHLHYAHDRLRTVFVKDDFGCRITAAQLIGPSLEPVSESTYGESSGSQASDASEPRSPHEPPPQVLVLVLETLDIMFLRIRKLDSGRFDSETWCRSLPASGRFLAKSYTHIAVDPLSRSMAVAAHEGTVALYKIKEGDLSRMALEDIVEDQIVVQTQLNIAGISFLQPREDDAHRVHCVLVGGQHGRLVLETRSWDSFSSLRPHKLDLCTSNLSFGIEQSLSTLIVPSILPGVLILVSENLFAAVTLDPDTGIIEHHGQIVSNSGLRGDDVSFASRGCFRGPPLWVNWARPTRNQAYRQKRDFVYFGREDGAVQWLSIDCRVSPTALQLLGDVGSLEGPINSAFAVLTDFDDKRRLSCPEALIAMGDQSDGAMYTIGKLSNVPLESRMDSMAPEKKEVLYNWAALKGCAVVKRLSSSNANPSNGNGTAHRRVTPREEAEKERLFATSRVGPHGAVIELRHGLELRIEHRLQTQFASVSLMQILQLPGEWFEVLVTSSPGIGAFQLLGFSDCAAFTRETVLGASTFELHLDEGSPSSCETSPRVTSVVAVVTSTRIFAFAPTLPSLGFIIHDGDVDVDVPIPEKIWQIERVSVVAMSQEHPLMMVVSPQPFGFKAKFIAIAIEDGVLGVKQCGRSIFLRFEPTCASFVNGTSTCAIGTACGTIHYLRCDPTPDGQEPSYIDLSESSFDEQSEVAIESLDTLQLDAPPEPSRSSSRLLICGMRDGRIKTCSVHTDDDFLTVTHTPIVPRRIGSLPVKIARDVNRPGLVYAHSSSTLCSLDFRQSSPWDPNIESIWLVDPAANRSHVDLQERCYTQRNIDAVVMPATRYKSYSIGQTVVFCGDELIIGRILEEPKAMPNSIPLPGTPKDIFYYSAFDVLIVSSSVMSTSDETLTRYATSCIFLIDPSSNRLVTTKPYHQCEQGESITSMCEWSTTKQKSGRSLQFIVLATLSIGTVVDPHTGRVSVTSAIKLLSIAKHNGSFQVALLRPSLEGREPIKAVTQCSVAEEDGFVYGYGKELRMRIYDQNHKRFNKHSLFRFTSEILQVTCLGNRVFVTTAEHSVHVLLINEGSYTATRMLAEAAHRNTLSHLALSLDPHSLQTLLLFSDNSGNISGLRQSNTHVDARVVNADFSARLMSPLTHLVKAHISMAWKARTLSGVLVDNLTGLCADGSMYSLKVLDETSFQFLHFIQALCLKDGRISPRNSTHSPQQPSLEFSTGGVGNGVKRLPQRRHIDADLLGRLARRTDAEELLGGMLDGFIISDTTQHQGSPDSGQHYQQLLLRTRFEALYRAVLQPRRISHLQYDRAEGTGRGAPDLAGDTVVRDTLRYIRALIESPF